MPFAGVDKRFEQVDKRFEQVDQRFEQVDQRFEQVDRRFEQVDRRFDAMMTVMLAKFEEVRELIRAELGQHTKAAAESNRADLRVIDDQDRDLPPRVTRLEATVFAPKPKKRAQRR